jgi:hypothetical protein
MTHACWCLPELEHGRPLLNLGQGAQSLHSRCGPPVALLTLRHADYLTRRKARLPLAGWALAAKELHLLDRCGFVWAHSKVELVRVADTLDLPLRLCEDR